MNYIEKCQNQLLEQIQALCRETPISKPTSQACLAIPRHQGCVNALPSVAGNSTARFAGAIGVRYQADNPNMH